MKESYVKYCSFAVATLRLILGGLVGFLVLWLIFIFLTNMQIVSTVTTNLQIPLWYPIIYLCLMASWLLSNFVIGAYTLKTKKYRNGGLSWRIEMFLLVLMFILFVILPSLINPFNFFVGV